MAAGIIVIRISLQRASQGQRLAKAVFGVDGKLLLNAGVEINERYMARLREHGVSEICVRAPHSGGSGFDDGVSDASHIDTIACAHACAAAVADGAPLPAGRAGEALEGARDDIRRSRGKPVAVARARSDRDWWETHAGNVALLAIATARALGLERRQTVQIGMGALLHDIGLIGLSPQPLSSPQQERDPRGRGHPVLGFQSLMINPLVSASSSVICLQHHERLDGSGFPKGIGDGQVSLGAQVCAVADAYDLLIAPPPFGHGMMPHLALAELRRQLDIASAEILSAFASAIAPYPVGTTLRLSDGPEAVVIETAAAGASMRLRLVSNNGAPASRTVELSHDRWAEIQEVL